MSIDGEDGDGSVVFSDIHQFFGRITSRSITTLSLEISSGGWIQEMDEFIDVWRKVSRTIVEPHFSNLTEVNIILVEDLYNLRHTFMEPLLALEEAGMVTILRMMP